MCGIAGIVMFDCGPAVASIDLMLRQIRHRGPDDRGVFRSGRCTLGNTRLSILDLSPAGHQPMSSNDGRFTVVYNGEIYNYLELRAELSAHCTFRSGSDTEVLLAAYQHWGEKCLDRFNGMWAFAIHDRNDDSVFLARDRFGVKPLYYYHSPGRWFVFASEVRALHAALPHDVTVDRGIVYEYLAYNRTDQSTDTFLTEIKRLEHGHVCRVSANGVVSQCRWYNPAEHLDRPWKNPGEYRETLSSAVGLRLRSDVPVGLCLSGGIDSSSIASLLLADHDRRDVHAFAAVYPSGSQGDERRFLQPYEQTLPNLHLVTPDAVGFLADVEAFLACHFEPVGNLSVYAQFKVMKELSRYMKVALDGQGNDEQFAGYDYFFGAYFRELLIQFRWWALAVEAAAYLNVHRSALPFRYLAFYSLPGSMKKRLRERAAGWIGSAFADAAREDSTLDTRLFSPSSLNEFLLQHFEYKLEHNLKWNDLNSMYFSVELRTPYMDFRVVERTLATAPDQKIRGGYTKWLQREALSGVLPDLIRWRSDKIGFDTPAGEWFRAPALRTFIEDLLGSRALADSGFLDIDACRQRYAAHLAGRVDASRDIWKWVHLSHFLNSLGAAAAETTPQRRAVVS